MQTSAEPKNLWLEVVASTEAKKKRTKRNFYRLHVNLADIKYAETIIKKTIVYTFSLPRKKFSSRYFEKKKQILGFPGTHVSSGPKKGLEVFEVS